MEIWNGDMVLRSGMEIWYNRDLIWRTGIEIWYGDLVWRSGIEIWYGDLVWRSGMEIVGCSTTAVLIRPINAVLIPTSLEIRPKCRQMV